SASERAERMLTLGRYEELVADLEPVVTGAPTRERLVGQLMTGLFNAGRQADSLAVYARTRQVLADELGLDPSRELRGLMERSCGRTPRSPRSRHRPGLFRGRIRTFGRRATCRCG
ncbi:MAG TPA: BTAD domain-containing putative transcriptional regulator, partial [Nakamurella sp.]